MLRERCVSALVFLSAACSAAPSPRAPEVAPQPSAPEPARVAALSPLDTDVLAAAGEATSPLPVEEATSPLSVEVLGTRTGQALHVQVIGVARDSHVGSPFEDPARWQVTALASGVRLDRLVAGSTKISRLETRGRRWDVTVEFDTAFGLPGDDSAEAEVVVTPPGATPARFAIGLARAR